MNKLIPVFAFGLLLTGCNPMNFVNRAGGGVVGSGNVVSEKRDLPPFTAIDTSGSLDIDVTCQNPQSVELQGDDNLLPLIKTEVRNGTLHISSEKNLSSEAGVQVRIAVPDITALSTSGASEVALTNVKNKELKVDTSGAADITAKGETGTLHVEMSGASNLEAGELRADKVSVELSGAGSADVYATSELSADISGAGSITYAGEPRVVNKNVSGFGSIEKK